MKTNGLSIVSPGNSIVPIHYTMTFNKRMKINATTEIIVSITVHVINVSLTVMPKYSLIIQKPESLTCDKINDPAPVANTSNSVFVPGMLAAIGATMPAAVIIDTVAEPVAIRMSAAIPHPNRSGDRWECFATSAICSPMPESRSTLLNAPPAPMTSKILATGPRQSLANFNTLSRLNPRA